MTSNKYESPEIAVTVFVATDVITTSPGPLSPSTGDDSTIDWGDITPGTP